MIESGNFNLYEPWNKMYRMFLEKLRTVYS